MSNPRLAYNELLHRGRVCEFRRVGVIMPDGRVMDRDLVHYGGAVVVLPILDDGRAVLIRNYRYAVDEHLLELPAGMIDPDEDPAVAAARELTEETGYTAGRIEPLGTFFTAPGTSDERMYAFRATQLTPGPQDLEDYEEIRVETVPLDELAGRITSGDLHDGKTLAALHYHWLTQGTT